MDLFFICQNIKPCGIYIEKAIFGFYKFLVFSEMLVEPYL